jgi:creatinine amidohydrolase
MTLLSALTWQEAAQAVEDDRLVIVPCGSTEAHGPHLPLDVDTHSADSVARLLAERVDALVAPVLPYGYAEMWMGFPGTITLSPETFEQVLVEIGRSLVRHGFRRIMLLNGHRPNGTAVDVAGRRIADEAPPGSDLQISALSYWEPMAAELHAVRRSEIGGMGHACELETSVQLATRPHLVRLDRLDGVTPPLVAWDLVGPSEPTRTYGPAKGPQDGNIAVFGDPLVASAESGERFLEIIATGLERVVRELSKGGGTYTTTPAVTR